jgi:signal transduction histidine kinase
MIEAREQRLSISLPTEPLWLNADPVRLAQVFSNLLNNSSKYTESCGQIWLTAYPEAGEAVVSVRDTGLGIEPELLPRVFDLFMQAPRAMDRSQGGLGIGLTVVRSLVEMHAGGIAAHSEGPGKGANFIVRLPALSRRMLTGFSLWTTISRRPGCSISC